MLRRTKKSAEKRKSERAAYPEFYIKHILKIKESKALCAECGCKLKGDVSEVAHILNKSLYKSVATNDDNVIYLCSWLSSNNCHSKFDDSSLDIVKNMIIYPNVKRRFEKIRGEVIEKINFKTEERFTWNSDQ